MLKSITNTQPTPKALDLAAECARIVAELKQLEAETTQLQSALVPPIEPDWTLLAERVGREKSAAARREARADVAAVEAEVAKAHADFDANLARFEENSAKARKQLAANKRRVGELLAELYPMKRAYRTQVIDQIMKMRGKAGNIWCKLAPELMSAYHDLRTCDFVLRALGEEPGQFLASESLEIPSHVTFVVKLPKEYAPDSTGARAEALAAEYRAALGELA